MNILELPIRERNFYTLSEYKPGEMKPAVSNVMFNVMFGSGEIGKKFVSYLLSLILNKDYKHIYDNIRYVKESLDRNHYKEKGKTVDLICLIDDKYYNIEINNNRTENSAMERNLAYASTIFSSSTNLGETYKYKQIIQININNFVFEGIKDEKNEYLFKDDKNRVLTDLIKIIQIYLPNIRNAWYNEDKELDELEAFLMAINEHDSDKLNMLLKGRKIMSEYRDIAKEKSSDEFIVGLYDKEAEEHAQKVRDQRAWLEQGTKNGLEQGIIQGSREKSLEIAKELLKNNIDINVISKCTSLSIEELEKLK